jgi:hypothetical protein
VKSNWSSVQPNQADHQAYHCCLVGSFHQGIIAGWTTVAVAHLCSSRKLGGNAVPAPPLLFHPRAQPEGPIAAQIKSTRSSTDGLSIAYSIGMLLFPDEASGRFCCLSTRML